jgi:putative nucleotidyltransferase with HDIG domain
MRQLSYGSSLFVMLAVLICGAVLYPTILGLHKERDEKTKKLFQSNVLVMKSLGDAIARRDSETGTHNTRVTLIAIAIAKAMGFPSKDMEALIIGALLHDIGKIAISDAILLKPGKLTDAEFEVMKTHVQHGESIIEKKGWLHAASDVISGHHERWDGNGYPKGLKGELIPLAARIFAVADVFDALVSRRPYKDPLDYQTAISMIEKDSGDHFDPRVVNAFKSVAKILYLELTSSSESALEKKLDRAIDRYLRVSLS